MAIRWTNYGRLSLIYLLQLRAFEIDSQKVDESIGLFHSSGDNKITTEQVNFPFIGPHFGASLWRFPLNRFRLRITPRLATWQWFIFCNRPIPLSVAHLPAPDLSVTVDRFHLYFSVVRSGGTYPIQLNIVVLSIVQVSALDSSTIIDVICLYFSVIRSSDTHSIPPGSVVLTSARVHKAELIQTVDLIRLDRRPLISMLHWTPVRTYPSCIF